METLNCCLVEETMPALLDQQCVLYAECSVLLQGPQKTLLSSPVPAHADYNTALEEAGDAIMQASKKQPMPGKCPGHFLLQDQKRGGGSREGGLHFSNQPPSHPTQGAEGGFFMSPCYFLLSESSATAAFEYSLGEVNQDWYGRPAGAFSTLHPTPQGLEQTSLQ